LYLMQTNQNSKALFIEEESSRSESSSNDQLQRKAAILQRINIFFPCIYLLLAGDFFNLPQFGIRIA